MQEATTMTYDSDLFVIVVVCTAIAVGAACFAIAMILWAIPIGEPKDKDPPE
jgi:hypothetical protein